MAQGLDRQKAEKLERMNIGYEAGYQRREIRTRVEELFRCEVEATGLHPAFSLTRLAAEELLLLLKSSQGCGRS
jgi:hypothetical protein